MQAVWGNTRPYSPYAKNRPDKLATWYAGFGFTVTGHIQPNYYVMERQPNTLVECTP